METFDHPSDRSRISYLSRERSGSRSELRLVAPQTAAGEQPVFPESEPLIEDDHIFRSLIVSGENLAIGNPWAAIGALIFQLFVLVAVAVCPRPHTDPLPKKERPTLLYLQPPPESHSIITRTEAPKARFIPTSTRTAISASVPSAQDAQLPRTDATSDGSSGADRGVPVGSLPEILGSPPSMPVPVVAKRPDVTSMKRIRVASGVAEANLIQSVPPQYPPEAGRKRIEGTVVLLAVICTDGTVKDVRVESGPPLLTQAAVDAVKQWRYKPYLLNGIPVEIDSRVTINFTMSGG